MGFIGGTGSGGSPVPPQIFESTTSSFVENQKAALSIVPENSRAVIPFTQQDQQMFLKYDTKAGDPMLAKPSMYLRVGADQEKEDTSWKDTYEKLTNNLHPVVKELLISENKKSALQRDPNFGVLNSLLIGTAKFISGMTAAHTTTAETTIKNTLNTHLPDIVLQGSAKNFGTLVSDSRAHLNELGANFPSHDRMSNALTQLNKLTKLFDSFHKKMESGENVKQSFVTLADTTHQLAIQNKKDLAGNFGILSAMFDTLDVIAASQSLENASPTLLIASHMANFDHDTPIGKIADNTVKELQEKIPNPSNRRLLSDITQALFNGITAASAYLAEQGIGSVPVQGEYERKSIKNFSFDMVLHLVMGSGLLETTLNAIAQATNATPKDQEAIAQTLNSVAVALATRDANTLNETLEHLDISQDQLDKNIRQLAGFAHSLHEAIATKEENPTSIVQAM